MSIERGENTLQELALQRSFGRWLPDGPRTVENPSDPDTYQMLDGLLSEPFPSGDRVILRYPSR